MYVNICVYMYMQHCALVFGLCVRAKDSRKFGWSHDKYKTRCILCILIYTYIYLYIQLPALPSFSACACVHRYTRANTIKKCSRFTMIRT